MPLAVIQSFQQNVQQNVSCMCNVRSIQPIHGLLIKSYLTLPSTRTCKARCATMEQRRSHSQSAVMSNMPVCSPRPCSGSVSPCCCPMPSMAMWWRCVTHTKSDRRLLNLTRLRAKTKLRTISIREALFADDAALATHTEPALQRLVSRLTLSMWWIWPDHQPQEDWITGPRN